jgi:5'(3')-deoxyribonucleotidase
MKKILYVDMDNVLVDFQSGVARLPRVMVAKYEGRLDEVPGIFLLMEPVAQAVESFKALAKLFEIYVLSTSPWENPMAWSDKLLWVKYHLGKSAYKRLILTHHKNLNRGDFLIDDRRKHGADHFVGEHILFGSERFPNWSVVVAYLRERAA